MKVAHVCTTALSHKILADKLAIMRSLDYEIHLISSDEGYDPELMESYGFPLRFVCMERSISPLRDIRSIWRMSQLFRKERYDIVHTHTAKAGIIGRIAARISGISLIVHTTHGLPFFTGQSKLKNMLYRLLEQVGAWFGHAIASQNREDLSQISAYAPKARVFYEGNGVDLKALDARRASVHAECLDTLRETWDIPSGVPILLVGARFEPVKNHDFLLKGLRLLKELTSMDFVCLLAGKGEMENDIRQQIQQLGLASQVKIVGHQTDLAPFLCLADIVALTSDKEGIPRILMEAMAYSKPVVATDVLGTRELVDNGLTGLLVPLGDVDELASAMARLLKDAELRRRCGELGRTYIQREFTEELVAYRIHSYYRELLRTASPAENAGLPFSLK